jgi:hypothetical protein
MQMEVKRVFLDDSDRVHWAVISDGVQVITLGSRKEANHMMDVLFEARTDAEKRLEQFYTGKNTL